MWCGGSCGECVKVWESVEEFGKWWNELWEEVKGWCEVEMEMERMERNMMERVYNELRIDWSCSFEEWLEELGELGLLGERKVVIIVVR